MARRGGRQPKNMGEITLAKNNLIELLPRLERARLQAISEPFELVLSDVLSEPGTPSRYAYFPTEGFISLVTSVRGHPGVEVGMVGRRAWWAPISRWA